MRAAITLIIHYFCSFPVDSHAQLDVDTLYIAGCSYVRYHPETVSGFNTMVINDTDLVVCDSAGALKLLTIQKRTLAMTIDSAYVDFKIDGNVVPEAQRRRLREQPSGAWICIELVVAESSTGEKVRLPAEKWVKL